MYLIGLKTNEALVEIMRDRAARGATVNLRNIALYHATSRVLSEPTKAYFAALAQRGEVPTYTIDHSAASDAYFEAAASCSTREGQSMARRYRLAELNMLRDADLTGQAIGPEVHSYRVVVADEVEGTLTVTMDHDGTVSTMLDVDFRALRNI